MKDSYLEQKKREVQSLYRDCVRYWEFLYSDVDSKFKHVKPNRYKYYLVSEFEATTIRDMARVGLGKFFKGLKLT